VFGKDPPSEMPTTKYLVKLAAFVKELIPRDFSLVRLAEFVKESVPGDGRSLKLRRTKLLATYFHNAIHSSAGMFEIYRYQVIGTNCCNVRQEILHSFCCVFHVLKVADFLQLFFFYNPSYICREMLIHMS
jgi:hypothetical protein